MKKLLTFLAFSIVFISCKKDDENIPLKDDPDTTQNPATPATPENPDTNTDTTGTQNCITLTSPLITDVVSPYFPKFIWQSCNSTDYRFSLYYMSDLSRPVLDTLLSDNSFQLQGVLSQDTVYYWKVTQGPDIASSQFGTGKYSSAIEGIHPVNIRHYYKTPPDSIWFDSTYTGNMEIRVLTNTKLLVSESVTGHSYEVYLATWPTDKDKIIWFNSGDGYNREIFLKYDLISKELEFSFRLGGIMRSGHFWIMKTTL